MDLNFHLLLACLLKRESSLTCCLHACDVTQIGHAYKGDHDCKLVWRIQFRSNISILITQHSYQIREQTRWHFVDTDKTYP